MKVLIAVDHSEAGQTVVREVAARPWPPQSFMEVLNVVEPAHLWSISKSVEETIELSTDLVHRAAEELRAKGLEASGLSRNGDAKRVILDRAKETNADFIFVGSQGVSALTHFFLGNVAAAIASHAPCSVEIVRKKDAKPGVHKILLATDGSEFSDRAARSIAERPWPEGTEVGVLSVVELVMGSAQALFEPPYVDSEQLEPLREAAMKRAQDAVSSAVEILSKTFPKVSESISVLLSGPKNVIIDGAEQARADLIVLGSHGHHGIERFLLGSVSQGVAMHAKCSVEVIR